MLKNSIVLLLMFTHLPTRAVSSITFFECSSDTGCSSEEKDEEYYSTILEKFMEWHRDRQRMHREVLIAFRKRWKPEKPMKNIDDVHDTLIAFVSTKRYDWEEKNYSEYIARTKQKRVLKRDLDATERVWDTERHHHRQALGIDDWGETAIRTVLGEEVMEGEIEWTRGTPAMKNFKLIPRGEDTSWITPKYLVQVKESYNKAYEQDIAFQKQREELSASGTNLDQVWVEFERLRALYRVLEEKPDKINELSQMRSELLEKIDEHSALSEQFFEKLDKVYRHYLSQVERALDTATERFFVEEEEREKTEEYLRSVEED